MAVLSRSMAVSSPRQPVDHFIARRPFYCHRWPRGFRLAASAKSFRDSQAVNAADIRGRTLHNACGLGVDAAALDRAASQEAAKRMSYWVVEISMVNARLLAQAHGNGTVSLAARPSQETIYSSKTFWQAIRDFLFFATVCQTSVSVMAKNAMLCSNIQIHHC